MAEEKLANFFGLIEKHPWISITCLLLIALASVSLFFDNNGEYRENIQNKEHENNSINEFGESQEIKNNLVEERDGSIVSVHISSINNTLFLVGCDVRKKGGKVLTTEASGVINVYDNQEKSMLYRIDPQFGGGLDYEQTYSFSKRFDADRCFIPYKGWKSCNRTINDLNYPLYVGCSLKAVAPPLNYISQDNFLEEWRKIAESEEIYIFEIQREDIK